MEEVQNVSDENFLSSSIFSLTSLLKLEVELVWNILAEQFVFRRFPEESLAYQKLAASVGWKKKVEAWIPGSFHDSHYQGSQFGAESS